jgi:hypothetical protein
MFGTLIERAKNAFFDKDTGSLKTGSIIAGVAGAVGGSMLLGPILAPLGIVGTLIGAVAGIAAGISIKEIVIPMVTGGSRPAPTQDSNAPTGEAEVQANAQQPRVETPDRIPPRPTGRQPGING